MKTIRIAGIIRKSPTKKNVKESIKIQMTAIMRKIGMDFFDEEPKFEMFWVIDEDISGDDPARPELNKFFQKIDEFDYAYCHIPDRLSRSYLGLFWFDSYFITARGLEPHKGCKLVFCDDVGDLYEDDGTINANNYFNFFIRCAVSQLELITIRKRTRRGIDAIKQDPELRKKKYPGRKLGSKNVKKKKN